MAHKNCATKTENTPRTKEVHSGIRDNNIDKQWRDGAISVLHLCGFPDKEIAQRLGCHRNTVANAIKAGPAKLPTDTVATITDLIQDATRNAKEYLNAGDKELRERWTRFVLDRSSAFGTEGGGAGGPVNITLLLEAIDKNRAGGLAAYGLVRSVSAGDN